MLQAPPVQKLHGASRNSLMHAPEILSQLLIKSPTILPGRCFLTNIATLNSSVTFLVLSPPQWLPPFMLCTNPAVQDEAGYLANTK